MARAPTPPSERSVANQAAARVRYEAKKLAKKAATEQEQVARAAAAGAAQAARKAALAARADLRKLEETRQALVRQTVIVKAREDFMTYVKFTTPSSEDPDDVTKSRYQNARHHDAIARALEEVVNGGIQQLILCTPPRHGKSELVTRKLPAWLAGRFPHENVVVGTYNDDFAADFGAEVRSTIYSAQHKQVFPESSLRRGGGAKDRIQTDKGGLLVFVGRGGSLTGRGAHTLILDDLIKDDKEAVSQTIRDQAWNWFTKVAMTRRMGAKRVIIVMTRWHADDVVGRLTDPENPCYDAQEAAGWKIINLPAIAEEDDPLGRELGAPLWPDGPDKFDLAFLESQRRLDPIGFSALYQQRPSAIDGDLFARESFAFYKPDELPDLLRFYAASDHAVATTERRDYTVLLTAGVDKNSNIYLLDCIWQRMKTDKACESMLALQELRSPITWWAGSDHITKSIGPFLRKRMVETQVWINLKEVPAVGDKVQRAQSIAARVASGGVYFPKSAAWTERAINELLAFPAGTHDDFVDAFALIGMGLQSLHAPRQSTKKELPVPTFGTLAWVKWVENFEKSAQRSQGGF